MDVVLVGLLWLPIGMLLGVLAQQRCFGWLLQHKAASGMRLAWGGRLYDVKESTRKTK